jgi:hypothetical protein
MKIPKPPEVEKFVPVEVEGGNAVSSFCCIAHTRAKSSVRWPFSATAGDYQLWEFDQP